MNKRFVTYKNGNYRVMIDLKTGTKIRENDLDFFRADFPESMDIKICNKCDMGCPMCHENSTPDGECGDIMGAKFIETLHPYTELAIGGGNPLEHPDFEAFLKKCKELKLIPSVTVHQNHFMGRAAALKKLCDEKLIYGLGVSLHDPYDKDFQAAIRAFPNAVVHVINGMVTPEALLDFAEATKHEVKILILGYKNFRRGATLYEAAAANIEMKKQALYSSLGSILESFSVVSFDNLAIEQLNPSRLVSNGMWDECYMGDDGTATMYIDMVKGECARTSTSTERFPMEDNIVSMFEKVRK